MYQFDGVVYSATSYTPMSSITTSAVIRLEMVNTLAKNVILFASSGLEEAIFKIKVVPQLTCPSI